MTKLIFTQDNLPDRARFQELLTQAEERSSLVDDLLGLLRQLVGFEQKYKLASDVFYARFMRGELGDERDFIKWAGRYELYLEVKQDLDSKLAGITVAA
jgi:hypothetical protein